MLHREAGAVAEAALIWARATAVRDQRPVPSTGEEKVLGIQRRLDVDGAELLIARYEDSAVGFTLFAPQGNGLEIFYLASDPDAWGRQIASGLLAAVEDSAVSQGLQVLELWVLNDNDRAIGFYERSGFNATGRVKHDPALGQTELRMVKRLGGRH